MKGYVYIHCTKRTCKNNFSAGAVVTLFKSKLFVFGHYFNGIPELYKGLAGTKRDVLRRSRALIHFCLRQSYHLASGS